MRDLRDDGVNVPVPMYVELRDYLNRYFAARGHQRAKAGVVESRGEKMGCGNALARLVAWYAHLNDADIEAIQGVGGAILEDQAQLPADYGKVPGRQDFMAIRRREAGDSALAREHPLPGPLAEGPHGVAGQEGAAARRGDQDIPAVDRGEVPARRVQPRRQRARAK